MASTKVVEQQPRAVMLLMSWGELLRVVAVGALVGIVTWASYGLLHTYILTPALCNAPELAARCQAEPYFSGGVATVIGAIVGLLMMVWQRVFRPLLVVLLASAGLWNVVLITAGFTWWLAIVVGALLFGITYAMFAWLAQIRNFLVSVIVGIVLVVVMRLIISA